GPGDPARLAETSLRLDGGDRLLVVGPNGAGMTLLLQVLAGVLTPSAGSVRWLSWARPMLLAQEDGADGAAAHGSPGERRRRALSALFAERPAVVLLDEPTNHLGISGVDD